MISIIIPCFNCESHVARAIESVLKQGYQDWELILIDNNSADGTIQILNSYQKKYPLKIKVLHELKAGAPAARNTGLKNAKGDWIQYLDADDELLTNKLQLQVYLINSTQADLISGSAIVEGKEHGQRKKSNRKVKVVDPWVALINSSLGITSANLFRRRLLIEIDGWNEQLQSSQEYDLMFRMLKAGAKVIFDQQVQAIIHVSDTGISRSNNVNKKVSILSNRINLRLAIKEYLKESGLLNKERRLQIDKYIYTSLKNEQINIPVYVNEQLRMRKLEIPILFRLAKEFQIFLFKLQISLKSSIKSITE